MIGAVHVYPVNDQIGHEISDECPCGPDIECVMSDDGPDGWLVTHHALDGRSDAMYGDIP